MTNKSTMLLEHNLKQLKLPTFLREYDKLASQCASEGADHPDYLLRLSGLAGSASVGGLWGTEQVFILWLCVRPKTSLPLSVTS